jgi:hypothetical protein
MNIFFLSWKYNECAELYCDQHVVKILLEVVQMLYTAHWTNSKPGWNLNAPLTKNGKSNGYKQAHPKHPTTIWVGSTKANYMWTTKFGMALACEHNRRFRTVHSCSTHILWLFNNPPDVFSQNKSQTAVYATEGFPRNLSPPPMCMPVEYHTGNIVKAYQNYYIGDKLRFARWKSIPV